jgi:hypothetical protein
MPFNLNQLFEKGNCDKTFLKVTVILINLTFTITLGQMSIYEPPINLTVNTFELSVLN